MYLKIHYNGMYQGFYNNNGEVLLFYKINGI